MHRIPQFQTRMKIAHWEPAETFGHMNWVVAAHALGDVELQRVSVSVDFAIAYQDSPVMIADHFAALGLNVSMTAKTTALWTAMIVLATAYVMMASAHAKMAGKERLAKRWRVQTIVPGMALAS